MEEPFTRVQSRSVFNMARFLYHALFSSQASIDARGVSRANVVYALAKKAREEEAYKVSSSCDEWAHVSVYAGTAKWGRRHLIKQIIAPHALANPL